MNQVLWIFAVVSICVWVCPARRIYRGRILTRPIRRHVRILDRHPFLLRLIQIEAAPFVVGPFVSHGALTVVGWLWFVALYVDDGLTGDDDRWKRFKGWAANRVKWMMELPVPAPERS